MVFDVVIGLLLFGYSSYYSLQLTATNLVENTSAEVIGDDGEAIRGHFQLMVKLFVQVPTALLLILSFDHVLSGQ